MNSTELIFASLGTFAGVWILGFILSGINSANKQAHRRKEMEHLERIKAMELGIMPSSAGLTWPAAASCIAIGAGVPVGSFAVCWLASLTAHVPGGIWVAPVFVSLSAIQAARKIAYRSLDLKSGAKWPTSIPSKSTGKPEFDPDAYDVVGSRG